MLAQTSCENILGQNSVGILAFPSLYSGISSKLLKHFKPQFPHLESGHSNTNPSELFKQLIINICGSIVPRTSHSCNEYQFLSFLSHFLPPPLQRHSDQASSQETCLPRGQNCHGFRSWVMVGSSLDLKRQ